MIASFSDLTQAIDELKDVVQKFLQALLQHPEPRSEIVIEELNAILLQKYEQQTMANHGADTDAAVNAAQVTPHDVIQASQKYESKT